MTLDKRSSYPIIVLLCVPENFVTQIYVNKLKRANLVCQNVAN